MSHSLLKDQNNPNLIKLLQASSSAYKRAKSNEYLYIFLYFGLAILYVVVYIFLKNEFIKHLLFGVSFLITISLWIFSDYFKGNTQQGALLKELFDTTLFGLEWKFMQAIPTGPEITAYADLYNDSLIANWYPDNISENLNKEQAIAVCQYNGSLWDMQLREKYLAFLEWFLALFISAVIIFILLKLPTWETIFLLAFSLLSFFSHFITLIKGNMATIKKRKKIMDKLDALIKARHPFTKAELRDIQDAIFNLRLEPSKIHAVFYRKYNAQIRKKCEKYIDEVNEAYSHW